MAKVDSHHKLSPTQVRRIFLGVSVGISYLLYAKLYRVHRTTVKQVLLRNTYLHIEIRPCMVKRVKQIMECDVHALRVRQGKALAQSTKYQCIKHQRGG